MKFGAQLGALGVKDRRQELALAKELGCQGMEVTLPVGDLRSGKTTLDALLQAATALKHDFDEAGMEFIALSPSILLKHAAHPEVIDAVCRVAQVLGTRQIRMFSAAHVRWGGPGSKLDAWMAEFDGTRDAPYWFKRNAEELAVLLELTQDAGLRFVFELHGGFVVNSASGAMRLIDRYAPDRVGILMDPGNMVFEGNEGWRNSVQIMGPYLSYIHCKNAQYRREDGHWLHQWAPLDEGVASFPEIVTALKDTGFVGYLCIEDLRREVAPTEKIGSGIAYLKRLVASPERVMPV